MTKPLRVLLVEDVEQDAVLVLRELSRAGYDVVHERVETKEAMLEALGQKWDVVISDYSMPQFSAPMALDVVQKKQLEVPFIIVSGTVGEDTAVQAIQAGAHDFMTKGKLARLVPAIERELRDSAIRAERAKIEQQLLVSERMASVGTLAASVAHEINNPLAAVIANLDFATQDVTKLSREICEKESGELDAAFVCQRLREVEDSLRDARDSAARVRDIVRDLKLFSRPDEEDTHPVDIRRVLESTVQIAWNEIRHRARLVVDYGKVPFARGNEGRLAQVFLNLLVNAAQAMEEGQADKNEIRVSTSTDEQGNVVVVVRDTGTGMSEAVLARIFDPFFTTKPIGVGSGLGLSVCHRIVTTLGGQIVVESEVGKGTTVRTILPSATGEPAAPSMPGSDAAPLRRGKVLVVDDEPILGKVVRRLLADDHDVVATTSAREAIQRVASGERYDVILCDVMMPDVTGMDLYAELTATAPEQAAKIVFMTGGAFTLRARQFLDDVRNRRIEKPFDGATLRTLVNRLISAGA